MGAAFRYSTARGVGGRQPRPGAAPIARTLHCAIRGRGMPHPYNVRNGAGGATVCLFLAFLNWRARATARRPAPDTGWGLLSRLLFEFEGCGPGGDGASVRDSGRQEHGRRIGFCPLSAAYARKSRRGEFQATNDVFYGSVNVFGLPMELLDNLAPAPGACGATLRAKRPACGEGLEDEGTALTTALWDRRSVFVVCQLRGAFGQVAQKRFRK